jgi:hypothetical protein
MKRKDERRWRRRRRSQAEAAVCNWLPIIHCCGSADTIFLVVPFPPLLL